jgi:hypothetical protein
MISFDLKVLSSLTDTAQFIHVHKIVDFFTTSVAETSVQNPGQAAVTSKRRKLTIKAKITAVEAQM